MIGQPNSATMASRSSRRRRQGRPPKQRVPLVVTGDPRLRPTPPADLVRVWCVRPDTSLSHDRWRVRPGFGGAIGWTRQMRTNQPDVRRRRLCPASIDCSAGTRHTSRWAPPPTRAGSPRTRRDSGRREPARQRRHPGGQDLRSRPPAPHSTAGRRAFSGYRPQPPAAPRRLKRYSSAPQPIHIRLTGDDTTGHSSASKWSPPSTRASPKGIDVAAAALHHGATVDQLNDLDLSYTPPLGSPLGSARSSPASLGVLTRRLAAARAEFASHGTAIRDCARGHRPHPHRCRGSDRRGRPMVRPRRGRDRRGEPPRRCRPRGPDALLPSLLTSTLGAPAAALGLIEGISDGLAGAARLAGGALADDPRPPPDGCCRRLRRHRCPRSGHRSGYQRLAGGVAASGSLGRSWLGSGSQRPARRPRPRRRLRTGLRLRASHGQPRRRRRPTLALALISVFSVRTAIAVSVIPGLLAAGAIIYAIRKTPRPTSRDRVPIRIRLRPVLRGQLGRLMLGISAFEAGNIAATLLILRATELLTPAHGAAAAGIALGLAPLQRRSDRRLDPRRQHG